MMIPTADGLLNKCVRLLLLLNSQLDTKKKGSFSISCSCALLKSFCCSDPRLCLFLLFTSVFVCGGRYPQFLAMKNAGRSRGRDCDPATVCVKWVMGGERASEQWSRGMICIVISSFELFPNLIHSQTASPKPTAVMHFQQIPQGLDEVWRHSFALTH